MTTFLHYLKFFAKQIVFFFYLLTFRTSNSNKANISLIQHWFFTAHDNFGLVFSTSSPSTLRIIRIAFIPINVE